MDWIEAWFGLNPDGGDGSIEALVIGAAVLVVIALIVVLNTTLRHRVAGLIGMRGDKGVEPRRGE
jgi:hypothetical protein